MTKLYKINIEFSIHSKSQAVHENHMAQLEDVLKMLNKLYVNSGHDYCDFELKKYIENDD